MQGQSLAQWWEDNYPSILSLLIVVGGLLALWKNQSWIKPIIEGVIKLAPSALNVSAIAMGFLATAQAILLSLADSRALIALRDSGHYPRLTRFFARALGVSFVAALLSAFLTAIRLNLGGALRYTLAGTWALFGISSLLCYYRATQLLTEILRINGSSAPSESSRCSKEEVDLRKNDIEILEN